MLLGGVLFGVGIGVMYYVGMVGMKINVYMYFCIEIVLLLVLIVVIFVMIVLLLCQIIMVLIGEINGIFLIFFGVIMMGGVIVLMYFIVMKVMLYWVDEICVGWVMVVDDLSVSLFLWLLIIFVIFGLSVVIVVEVNFVLCCECCIQVNILVMIKLCVNWEIGLYNQLCLKIFVDVIKCFVMQ